MTYNPAHLQNIEMVDREMANILASKTGAERLQIAWGMWRSARMMLTNVLRSERPEASEEELSREVARRMSHGAF